MTARHLELSAMCFSATASFTVAAVLVPAGAYCVSASRQVDPGWMPLGMFPFAFSIQQVAEGLVWLGIASDDPTMIGVASRVFLFFSHFFWLAWLPYAVSALEADPSRQKTLRAFAAIGGVAGLSVFLPTLFLTDWLSVQVVQHSLSYEVVTFYDDFVSRSALRRGYGLLIAASLFLSSDVRVRVFGSFIIASLLISYLHFAHTLVSVWCFFAAVSSVLIVMILAYERRQQHVVA